MVQLEREVRFWTDCILGSDRRIFQNVVVRDPRHNSDHFMVMGCMRGASLREHSRYLRQRTRLPLRPPGRQARTQADKTFTELWSAGGVPQLVDCRGDVEARQRESLREGGTREVPGEVATAGKGDLGSTEGGQATAGGDGG